LHKIKSNKNICVVSNKCWKWLQKVLTKSIFQQYFIKLKLSEYIMNKKNVIKTVLLKLSLVLIIFMLFVQYKINYK